MQGTISNEEILGIVFGEHKDPFSVLGYHEFTDDEKIIYVIRVFIPDAIGIIINIPETNSVQAMQIHPAGFFEARLNTPLKRMDYQLEVLFDDGSIQTMFDPYSFGTLMSSFDVHLIGEGTEEKLYLKLGAHIKKVGDFEGVYFSVWAPNAKRVSVAGDFNGWNGRQHPMRKLFPSGIWELFIPGLKVGTHYKYEIVFPTGHILMKADPMAFQSELRPRCASIVTDLFSYNWKDNQWLTKRSNKNHFESPLSIYEVHLGSWKQLPPSADNKEADEEIPFLNYRDLAKQLVAYIKKLGYTHIELMPVMEHLLDASWGYQVTGFYAPTSRYGTPDDFKFFVDYCHQNDIGVIMDWVPAHFPKDYTALARFDGTALYEHLDPRKGFHPHWGTYIFNYERNEVRNFLVNSALFWLDQYHLDGLRVDAVASMLYLDYGREDGNWLPNKYGGRENIDAIEFLQELNIRVHEQQPGVMMIAEESTSWPLVSKPVYLGGLGFDFKWNMGWMNDFLKYMSADPIFRKFQQTTLTWSLFYAFSENFILPLSHDEVVHLKRSLLDKMPGDYWKKMANLRLCYGMHFGHPGKKLLFMGGEIGQWREWTETRGLDWNVLEKPIHKQLQHFVASLNELYVNNPALWEIDFDNRGFQWIDFADADLSIISFIRKAKKDEDELIWIFNFTPVPHADYRFGLPHSGEYEEIFNSDESRFGGSNITNSKPLKTENISWHGFDQSHTINLPPLAFIVLKRI